MVTVNIVGELITGTINNKHYAVKYSKERFDQLSNIADKVYSCTDMEEYNILCEVATEVVEKIEREILETKSPYIAVCSETGNMFLKYGDKVSNIAIPDTLKDKIQTALDKDLDIFPMIKAMVRFMRTEPGRPDRSKTDLLNFDNYIGAKYFDKGLFDKFVENGIDEESARAMSYVNQVAITQEGLICAYKVSREVTKKFALDAEGNKTEVSRYKKVIDEDTGIVTYEKDGMFAEDYVYKPAIMSGRGDSFFCVNLGGVGKEGHIIRVGHRHFLDSWDKVSSPGIKGLHAGNLDYIRNYQTPGTITHNVFICPSQIYGFTSGSDGALTCKEYFVHSSFQGVNKNLYISSVYAELRDSEYDQSIKKMVEENLAELEKEAKSLKSKF